MKIKIKRIKDPLVPKYENHLRMIYENRYKYIPNKREVKK